MKEQIEIVDRYSAMGIPHPDPATMCEGQCEGTGVVPVYKDCANSKNAPWRDLWLAAEAENPADNGYHFVTCPTCNGTRLKDPEPQTPDGKD